LQGLLGLVNHFFKANYKNICISEKVLKSEYFIFRLKQISTNHEF